MKPINPTEELLLRISNNSEFSKEKKIQLINRMAYPDQSGDYAAGTPCAVCPPPHARVSFVENTIRSLDNRYTVTIYIAHPGTPLNDKSGNVAVNPETGKRVTSAAGHMWYEISDEESNNSYGFAPLETGITGAGKIFRTDTTSYEKPRYSRTLEITEYQYNQLKEYGESAIEELNADVDLYYNGVNNSCVDFTWKALRSAKIKFGMHLNDSYRNQFNKIINNYDGAMKVDNNISQIKSLIPPFPNSSLNTEKYNDRPKKDWRQKLLTQHSDSPNSSS